MIFTQPAFIAFFLVCFVGHWALPWHRARKVWLLCCSYFFYGYWDYRFLALIVASTIVDYAAARLIDASSIAWRRRAALVASLTANLGMLGFFKYYNFFVSSAATALESLGVGAGQHTLEIILPVGISFFTFQTMSYTIDVYRHRLACRTDLFDFALYVGFFPQLVAGPIVRAVDFLPQLDSKRRFLDVNGRRALLLFLAGFLKKACIADNIGPVLDPIFANPTAFGQLDLALAACLYSVQIYCDFSGYSDMAIGTGAALGYELPKNFDAPYFSRNVREFWRRWHISLSSWLRDYLYISLGGSQRGSIRTSVNLMLTMLLGGLWHGANWTFVLWGFLHGLALLVHRQWERLRGPRPTNAARPLATIPAWLGTFTLVALCFALFRSPDIATAAEFFAGMVTSTEPNTLSPNWFVLLGLLALAHWVAAAHAARLQQAAMTLSDVPFYAACGASMAVMAYFVPLDASPFIYFQF